MKEMGLVEHLEELRKTVVRIALILAVSFAVAYAFGDIISEFLLRPLRTVLAGKESGSIVYLGVLDKVISQLQVAFWSSVLLSSPFWFFEIWRFIRPGLHQHEIRAIRPFILVGFILFCLGVFFGYYLVFPMTFQILMDFGVKQVEASISLKEYLILACKVLLFFGLVFQLPNLLLILGFMGLVTKYSLRQTRRYVYVAFAVVAALMTPPDVVSQMALWFPLVILYEVGIFAVAFIVHPYLEKQNA